METAVGALHAGTFCHIQFNHFYLPSTALSKCWHGHFRTGLIIFRYYDGHFLYLINPERQVLLNITQLLGSRERLPRDVHDNTELFLQCLPCLSSFNCFHLFLVLDPLGELRAEEFLFWEGGIFFLISRSYPSDYFSFFDDGFQIVKVSFPQRPNHNENFSVTESCLTLCNFMDCSTPGLHHLLEFAQVYIYWIGGVIQPSHPLPPSSPFAFNLSEFTLF